MKPLFSIITVTYNAGSTIKPTLESVAAQSFTDFEHLIIDGASTDSTLAISEAHAIPAKTKILSEPDSGLYDAMNKGIDRAVGEYLIFLNSGDALHSPDTLNIIARSIKENDMPGIVYGQTAIVNSQRQFVAERHLTAPQKLTYDSFRKGMVVCHQSFVVLSRIAPMFSSRYRFSADFEWCLRCLQHSRKNVYVDAVFVDYLFEGLSTKNRRKSLVERFKIMTKYYGFFPTVINHFSFIPRFIARTKKERKIKETINT